MEVDSLKICLPMGRCTGGIEKIVLIFHCDPIYGNIDRFHAVCEPVSVSESCSMVPKIAVMRWTNPIVDTNYARL